MKQFTVEQVAHLREKVQKEPGILASLEEAIAPVRAHYRIQQTGRASWGGFYACPTHSVRLEFDIANPHSYRCPVDGEIFTGEPYESAWWRMLNSANENACRKAALRYMLLGEAEDLALARRILVDYARYYPGYEVHGNIPYNNPGKANAQTLCDADWVKGLAMGYDIIRDALSPEDRALIERDLFRCCADFLMAHRKNHIHNHECIVSSAVGIIGMLVGDEGYTHFALDTPYGLKYQLEHGVLSDGFWFEGTPSYHFYAMQQFVEYEQFTQQAGYSFFTLPRFAEILKFPMHLIQPDGYLPLLNDAGNKDTNLGMPDYLYEDAYARTRDVDFAKLLRMAYEGTPRANAHAFFFGVDALPEVSPPEQVDYHDGGEGASGLTTMHGPQGRFLLVKHSPYGGEHDHYDRLGLHFLGLGRRIAPDIGTTQYGAPLHYAYYKNTASHNTVCIDGQNQPPANCRVRAYHQDAEKTVLDAEVRWDGSYVPLDSFVIKQWSDAAYAGAILRRHITWYGDFFVDCFDVRTPAPRTIDWTLHVRGERVPKGEAGKSAGQWATDGPGQYIHSVTERAAQGPVIHSAWHIGADVQLDMYTLDFGGRLYDALGPDNPSVSDLAYLFERVEGTTARFVNIIAASNMERPVLRGVIRQGDALLITRNDGREVHCQLPEQA